MYYFVEYMRAKRALRLALILLGLVLLAAIILRIAVHGPSVYDWGHDLENSPTAHVTRTQLPDGSTRTVVDDPAKQTHAVIVERGDNVRMDIFEPKSRTSEQHDNMSMGSMSMNEDVHGGIAHVTVTYKHGFAYDFGILFLVTIPMGLIIATCLSGPLAKENDGHLELAWTKPVSRERYALEAIGVDVVAIVIAQLLTIAVILLGTLLFVVPRFTFSADMGWPILLAVFGPMAWYGLLTAASSSLKRGPGLVMGLGWLFAIIVPALGEGLTEPARFNSIAAGFHAIFLALSYLDPIAYMSLKGEHGGISTMFGLSISMTVAVLAALSIGYIALSVLQWRRVEA